MLNSGADTASVESVITTTPADSKHIRAHSAPFLLANFKPLSKWLSDDTLTKKAYLNALAAALDYIARLTVGFIVQPLLVRGLGSYSYGAWQVLGRLIAYISPASGRPTQALKWTIANGQASTDYDEKRRHVGSTVVVWLLFLPVLVALGGLLAWFAPTWLHTSMELSRSVRVAAALLVADLIMGNLAEVPRSVLQGENLGYKRMGLSTVLVCVGGGLTALAMYFRTGLMGVATANLATTLLTGALFLQVVRTYAPWFGMAVPSKADVRRFFGLSWWFLVWRLVMQLMMASDVVVLGMLNSVEKVTTYTLTKYAPETLISWVAIVVFAITPGLGGVIGSGNLRKAVQLRNEIMSLTWLIATVVGTTALLWNRAFIRLWVGKKYDAGLTTTLLVMVMAIQLVLIRNDANIIDLTLKLRTKVLIGGLSAIVSLFVAGVLVGPCKAGITGLCLGFIAGRSILSVAYPWLVGHYLGVPLSSQFKGAVRSAFVTILLFVLALILGNFLTARTWFGLVSSVGLTTIVMSISAFYIGFSAAEQQRLWQRVRAVMRPGI